MTFFVHRYKRFYLVLLLALGMGLLAPFPTPLAVAKLRKNLSLTVGVFHQEKLPSLRNRGSVRFSGDYKRFMKVSFSQRLGVLRFEPRRIGVATLTVRDSKGQKIVEYYIDVKKSNLSKIIREVRSLLVDIEGIEIKIINNRVVVDGQILLPGDMNRIVSVLSQYSKEEVDSMVSLSPLAQRKIAQFIERDINNPEVQVRTVNSRFILEGTVNTPDEKKQAEEVARIYVPDVLVEAAVAQQVLIKRGDAQGGGKGTDIIINRIKVRPNPPTPPKKLVQMVIHYVEFNKSYQRGFLFQWTPAIKDGGVDVSFGSRSGLSNIISGTINNLIPKLNWAKTHGQARVLKTSTIIAEDG